MKLLVAAHARGPVGGVETYLRGVVPALIARGHRVALLCEHRFESEASADPDPYAACAAEWMADGLGIPTALAGARAWRPDWIWTHGLHDTGLETELLELAPAVLFAHNYDGTCATGLKFHRWPRPQPCERTMGAACLAINFTRHCGLLRPSSFAAVWQRQRQREKLFPRYRSILVNSRHLQADFERQGVAAERLRAVAYPLQEPRGAAPAPRAGLPTRLLMLARLTPAKGGGVLLRAMALAQTRLGRGLALTLAGDGPERADLQQLAQRLRLDVAFPGWITGAERRRHLAAADLLAVPSLWPEPYGMVGVEAAALGVPAVAFAVGGIPEWLHAGENGELAPAAPLTAEALAQALVRALGDPPHWERLRQGAWESSAHYDLDDHLDRLEAIFQDQVGAHA